MVLLPYPLGPSSPTTSPSATENDTSRTARRGPYHLTRFCTPTTGALMEGLAGVRARSSSHTSAIACCAPAHPLLPLPPPFSRSSLAFYAAICRLRPGNDEFKLAGIPVIPALQDHN